jgi:predicted dehydrogenase
MIKLGFVGVGSMGKNHLRVAMELNKYFNVVGICDCDEKRSKEMSEIFGVDVYTDIEELLNCVDAIVIATPASTHYEIGLKAVKLGKHVLMEKPVCLSIEDAEKLKTALKSNVFMVSHVERFNPVVVELCKLIQKEEVVAIEMHRCSPYDKRIFDADVIEDLMIHDADILINELWPHEINEMTAFGNHMFSKKNYDYVEALIKFKDNVICSIVSSRSTQDKIRTINVHTKSGYYKADMLNRHLTITRRTKYTETENTQYKQDNVVETLVLPLSEPLKEEYITFYNCIVNKLTPKTNINSSINTLKFCKKIQDICSQTKNNN